MKQQLCYWCSQPAAGREHVPPRCLFPLGADTVDGVGYREQLITVPSCDLHNGAKSQDDEYLLCVLAFSILNNPVGQQQAVSKVLRALKQAPGLTQRLLGTSKEITVEDTESGQIDITLAFKVDTKALESAFEHIARGVFFHHFAKAWAGTVRVLPEFLVVLDSPIAHSRNAHIQQRRESANALFSQVDRWGANPGVFFYQLIDDPNQFAQKLLRLTFYEKTSVIALFEPPPSTTANAA